MNPIEASLLCILIVAVLVAPRRWAFIAMMTGVVYLGQGSGFNVAGFNMYATRFLELAGFTRVVMRGEISFTRLNSIDRTVLLLYSYSTIVFLLRSDRDQLYMTGIAVDALLCYFSFRGMMKTVEEFQSFLRIFVVVLIPFVLSVLIESFTSHNPLEVLGGTTGVNFRAGRIRCLGSFRNPGLLGTFGGVFLPVYIGLWFVRNGRFFATIGIVSCLAIVWASNSGSPISLVGFGLLAWLMWPARTKMHLVRRLLSGSIILLALVMKAPIWYLLAKVADITGGDGYHRARVLDMAFQDLHKWWLFGMSVNETVSWLPYHMSTGGVDITNTFVSFGLTGGLLSVILFVVLLKRVLSSLGKSMKEFRKDGDILSLEKEYLYWGLAVVVTVHILNWLEITYFDQTSAIWFMQLAVMSTLTERIRHPEVAPRRQEPHSLRRQPLATPSLQQRA